MIQFRDTVRIGYFGEELAHVLHHASIWSLAAGKNVYVYSVADLTHSQGSLHPYSLALDLDVVGNVRDDLEGLYQHLRRFVRAGYDVVFEDNHVHVEFDTHRIDALAPAKTAV